MKLLLVIQCLYFFAAGIWPVIHIKSFVRVTGPKADIWLVKAVGLLVSSIAISMFAAFYEGNISTEIMVLAFASSVALFFVDIYYTAINRISPVYLLDAVAELAFLIGWFIFLFL